MVGPERALLKSVERGGLLDGLARHRLCTEVSLGLKHGL